jgi:flagellar biosynthetic protein FliO
MVLSRKKIFVFLITVILGSCLLFVCSAKSPTEETEVKKTEPESESNSLFRNDSDFLTNTKNRTTSGSLIFRFIISILFLIALGVGGIYVSKRFLPKITHMSEKEIRIIETVHLGPRKSVHLLEIGERRFLIGSTNENVTKLAELTNAFSEV